MTPEFKLTVLQPQSWGFNYYAIFQWFREKHYQGIINRSKVDIDKNLPGTDAESYFKFY